MISVCAQCEREIDTDSIEGSEHGVVRGWDGPEIGYRDYHRLCREGVIADRRKERRVGQAAPSSGQSRRRDTGKAKAQPAAAVADEMG